MTREETGEFAPFGVGAAAADRQRLSFEPLQGFDLDAQFGHRAGGGGLVENALLCRFQLVVGRFVEVVEVFAVEARQGCRQDRWGLATPLEDRQFA
jgi:hypothetical protein